MKEILALRCVKILSNVDEVKEWAVATGEEEEKEEEKGNQVSTKHEPLPYNHIVKQCIAAAESVVLR